MADQTDHYQVETEYTLKDGTTGGLRTMERGFKAVAHEARGLKDRFREFRMESGLTSPAMLGVGFGLGAWAMKAKEAVHSFEKTRKSMAGLMAETMQWPSHMSGIQQYTEATKMGTEVTEALEDTVRSYGGSLDEASAGFKQLTASVAPMHLTSGASVQRRQS